MMISVFLNVYFDNSVPFEHMAIGSTLHCKDLTNACHEVSTCKCIQHMHARASVRSVYIYPMQGRADASLCGVLCAVRPVCVLYLYSA